ncbi:MAG: hypothetical protein ACRC7N_04990 [Clostridium sp.]
MKDIELIDIDEESLPKISLSDEELSTLSGVLINRIKKFQSDNSTLIVDTSPTKVGKIVKELGAKAKEKKLSVEYFNVLKELVVWGIENQNTINEEDIIFKGFLYSAASHQPYLPATWANIRYYYYMYLTNKDLTVYSLDAFCKVIEKRIIPLNTIVFAEIIDRDPDGTELFAPQLMIRLDPSYHSNAISLYLYLLGEKASDTTVINELEKLLKERTTNSYKRRNFSWLIYATIIFWVIFFIIMTIES